MDYKKLQMKEIQKQVTHFISGGSCEDYASMLVLPVAAITGIGLGLVTANIFEQLALSSELGYFTALTIGIFTILLTADYLEITPPNPNEILIFG